MHNCTHWQTTQLRNSSRAGGGQGHLAAPAISTSYYEMHPHPKLPFLPARCAGEAIACSQDDPGQLLVCWDRHPCQHDSKHSRSERTRCEPLQTGCYSLKAPWCGSPVCGESNQFRCSTPISSEYQLVRSPRKANKHVHRCHAGPGKPIHRVGGWCLPVIRSFQSAFKRIDA